MNKIEHIFAFISGLVLRFMLIHLCLFFEKKRIASEMEKVFKGMKEGP